MDNSNEMNNDENMDSVNACYILSEDIEICNNELNKNPANQFWRRIFIRAYFALVEAWVNNTMLLAIETNEIIQLIKNCKMNKLQQLNVLTYDEISLLHEKTYRISNNGKAEESKYYGSTASRLLFSLNMFRKLINENTKQDISENRWVLFKEAIKLRDRIVHPRKASQLSISDNELKEFKSGIQWYKDQLLPIQDRLKQLLKDFRRNIKGK